MGGNLVLFLLLEIMKTHQKSEEEGEKNHRAKQSGAKILTVCPPLCSLQPLWNHWSDDPCMSKRWRERIACKTGQGKKACKSVTLSYNQHSIRRDNGVLSLPFSIPGMRWEKNWRRGRATDLTGTHSPSWVPLFPPPLKTVFWCLYYLKFTQIISLSAKLYVEENEQKIKTAGTGEISSCLIYDKRNIKYFQV